MTDIPGVTVTPLESFADERGSLSEIARAHEIDVVFAQANHSHSRAGVLRGLHYHRKQTDLWYLVTGRAQVCLVDLRAREGDPRVATFVIDGALPSRVVIPPGVAHGYLALTDIDILYLTDQEWDPDDEHGLAWNDPTLGIDWAIADPSLSERDRSNPRFNWRDVPAF